MREFFIRVFETFVSILVVLMIIAVIVMAVAAAGHRDGGLLTAIMILIGGGLYVIAMGGLMYLGLGIYHNTRRSAEALEAMARK